MSLREKIAELEHEQWMVWSKAVADTVIDAQREKWEKSWKPYSELTEQLKARDRVWADKVLRLVAEWGNEWCSDSQHRKDNFVRLGSLRRHLCLSCWQGLVTELRKEG